MADHQEMIHPPAATTTGSTSHGHGGDWWTTAVSCSPDQLPAGFGAAGWSSAEGNKSRSGNAASSESPGSNHSLATGASSVTFQDPAGAVADQGVVAMPSHPGASGLATSSWNQPSYYLWVSSTLICLFSLIFCLFNLLLLQKLYIVLFLKVYL
jgi:hypothetical protein